MPSCLTEAIGSSWRRLAGIVTGAVALALLQACSGGTSSLGSSPTPKLVAIQINPSNSLVPLAATRQLLATGTYDDGFSQDITATVSWSVSSSPSPTNFVAVDSNGVASGLALGTSIVSATLGPVVGVTPLTVSTNGYSSTTTGILTVPFKQAEVDAAYLPQSQALTQDVYTVQVVNLDADALSSILPVASDLIAAIPMPPGFVPNATAADQNTLKVAVISYTSPNVQVIDAANDPTDPTNNSVIATYISPITKSVSFNRISCMICAAVINPSNDQLLLSTAEGYYTLDLNAGTFTPLPFAPAALPSESFLLNPIATNPFLVSPTFGQGTNPTNEVQTLNLTMNASSSYANWGLSKPNAAALDLLTNYGVAVDAGANDEALVNLADPQNPVSTLVSNISVCAGVPAPPPAGLSMVALGIGVGSSSLDTPHTVFLSQPSGSCVGFETWPNSIFLPLDPTQISYAFGTMPPTPDGNPFSNGNDPNAITTFTSVVDKKNYGVLVNANQNWIAKLNLGNLSAQSTTPLPGGQDISGQILAGSGGDPVVYLPAMGTVLLSPGAISFGNQQVGTSSIPVPITLTNVLSLTNISITKIAIEGSDAVDFSQTNDCTPSLLPLGKCTIAVTFSPKSQAPSSGELVISLEGANPQTVQLTGTGN
jgi:hypothetical protein